MPQPFVQLSPELLDACRQGSVITPTERLRRELVRAYDHWMSSRGEHAWRSLDAFSLDGWFAFVHRHAREDDPDLPRLLSPTAELLLWQHTAPAGQEGLAPLARDAWALARQWAIPLGDAAAARTENGRLFVAWAERFARALSHHNLVTPPELPALLAGRSPADRVCCFAFEPIPAAVQGYLEALIHAGTAVSRLNPSRAGHAKLQRLELPDRRAEIGAAAQWCREVLLREPEARIGVVVPDLAERHEAVERQFAAHLEPVGSAGARRCFELAGGRALAHQAVWGEAELWLRLCFDRLRVTGAQRLLTARYLALPPVPALPETLPEAFTLSDLSRSSRDERWMNLDRGCPEARGRLPLAEWVGRFRHALTLAGWTGRRTGSVQYQAFQQCRTLLDEVEHAATYPRPCTASAALAVVNRLARQRLFAPQRPPVPVQILGYLETTGLTFTHLWITGLTDVGWPAPPRIDPLLPLSLQRRHGVPRLDASAELDFAARRLGDWQRSAGTLVVSHGIVDDEARHEPSPLIRHLPATPHAVLVPALTLRSHPDFVRGNVALVGDSTETATPPSGADAGGGSSLLRDQALCPFRRWALHDLGLRQPVTPHGFPDARDRGVLVHAVLHRALERDGLPGHPDQLTPEHLDDLSAEVLETVYRRFPAPVREVEGARLRQVLRRWLEIESQRLPFTVAALEHDVEVTLGSLRLRLRLDRLDRTDGALVVLDYKTGRTRPERLFDARLREPQLPLYALTDPAVQAVLFIELGEDDVKAKGIAAETLDLTPARLATLPAAWDAVRERWHTQLSLLAEEISRGRAEVAPIGAEACRICHLQPFCRIDEHPQPAEANADIDLRGS